MTPVDFIPLRPEINPADIVELTAEPRSRSEQNLFWRIRLRAGINVLN